MFEVVRPSKAAPSRRELVRRLSVISQHTADRSARINALTGLIPQVMESTAALTQYGEALASEVPNTRARLNLIVDVATAAMLETAIEADP